MTFRRSMRARIGLVRLGIAVLLGSLLGGDRALQAQSALRAKTERETVELDLARLGFEQGLELRGTVDTRSVHFPTLAASRPESGRLRLLLDVQLPTWQRAVLEVRVRDRGVLALDLLRWAGSEVVLPLEPADLREPFIRVDFELRGSLADDRCVDDRTAGGFVRILPRSGLELVVDTRRVDEIRNFWETLPRTVEIAVASGRGGADVFHTALLVGLALARSGREILYRELEGSPPLVAGEFGRLLPVADQVEGADRRSFGKHAVAQKPPHVVIGDPEIVAFHMKERAWVGDREEPLFPRGTNDLSLVRTGRTSVLFVHPRAGPALDRLVRTGLVSLAAGTDTNLVSSGSHAEPEVETVPLGELGVELRTRWIGERGGWRFGLPLVRLPAGRVPVGVVLDVAAPAGSGGRPVSAAVWLDEELLHTGPLPDGPGPHRLRLNLPERDVRLAPELRVELVRQAEADPCTSRPTQLPAQLLASSYLILGAAPRHPRTFAELAALLDEETPLLVERDRLDRPTNLLTTLVGIGRHLFRPGAPGRVIPIDGDDPLRPERPFLLVGGVARPELVAPLRLDRGRVALVGRASGPLLEIAPGTNIAVAQLVRLGEQPGLQLAGLEPELPSWPGDRLDREDLVVGDRSGTRIALRTTRDTVIRVAYPEAISWFDRLAPWRWGLILAFWAALSACLVVVLRRRA